MPTFLLLKLGHHLLISVRGDLGTLFRPSITTRVTQATYSPGPTCHYSLCEKDHLSILPIGPVWSSLIRRERSLSLYDLTFLYQSQRLLVAAILREISEGTSY